MSCHSRLIGQDLLSTAPQQGPLDVAWCAASPRAMSSMGAHAVTLHLPTSLYDLLRQRAQETRQSLEAEILAVVTALRLNRDPLVFLRKKWVSAGWHPSSDV